MIAGQGTVNLDPAEGDLGLFRGSFKLSRLTSGGRRSVAVSDLFLVGAFEPDFSDPVQNHPMWTLGQVPPADRPPDNTQAAGISNLDGCEYIQIRLTFVLRPT